MSTIVTIRFYLSLVFYMFVLFTSRLNDGLQSIELHSLSDRLLSLVILTILINLYEESNKKRQALFAHEDQ